MVDTAQWDESHCSENWSLSRSHYPWVVTSSSLERCLVTPTPADIPTVALSLLFVP